MTEAQFKSATELLNETGIDFTVHKAENYVDKKLVVREISFAPSDFGGGEYAIMECTVNGKPVNISCGGNMVVRKLRVLALHLPFEATLIKDGRSYDLK